MHRVYSTYRRGALEKSKKNAERKSQILGELKALRWGQTIDSQTLAETLDLSLKHTQTCLKSLVGNGLVERIKTPGAKSRYTFGYRLHADERVFSYAEDAEQTANPAK